MQLDDDARALIGSGANATLVTLNSASPLTQELADLPCWIRYNVTTAGTGTVTISTTYSASTSSRFGCIHISMTVPR